MAISSPAFSSVGGRRRGSRAVAAIAAVCAPIRSGALSASGRGWFLAATFDFGSGGNWDSGDAGRGDVRPAPGRALRPASGLHGRSASRRGAGDTSTGASVRIDGEAPDVAQVTRGPLGVTLPSDQPSAGQRAGRGSGPAAAE